MAKKKNDEMRENVIQVMDQNPKDEYEKLVIEKYPVKKKDDKAVSKYVVSEFERYEKGCSEKFERARKILKHWKQDPLKRDEDWQNAVPVPLIFEAEQTLTPRIHTALFPNDAPMDIKAEGDVPAEQAIEIRSLIQHYFRVCNVQSEVIPTLSQMTLLGTGYVESGSWFVKRGWQVRNYARYFTTLESRPDFKFVDFFEIFPHPAKKEMGDGLPIIRRQVVDAEYLKTLKGNHHFATDNLDKALKTSFPAGGVESAKYKDQKAFELLHFWGPYDDSIVVEKGTENEQNLVRPAVPYWIIVVNRSVVIRCIPNPFNHQLPPFAKCVFYPDPQNPWFGLGSGDAGLSTQERVNKLVNQRLDNVDLVLNKQGCYNGNDPLINKKKLEVSRPGQWHKTSDTVTSIRWMDTPDVTASAYREEEMAKQDFRLATGATAQLMPTETGQHRTAMGINLLQGAAGIRFKPVLTKCEVDLVQQTAMFFFSNLKQFMSHAEWVLITGKNGAQQPVLVKPEQIQAKVFFIPTGISETINREVQVGQLLRFREITAQDPTVNRQEINKRIAELFGFKDLAGLFVPVKPVSQDGLDTQTQLRIQQRLAEGASPQQIKEELLGARPAPQPMNLPQEGYA